jgi:hypothetical protein
MFAHQREGHINHRSPGHHTDGGSFAEILVVRSATKWLRSTAVSYAAR